MRNRLLLVASAMLKGLWDILAEVAELPTGRVELNTRILANVSATNGVRFPLRYYIMACYGSRSQPA